MDFSADFLPYLLIAIAIGAVIGFLLFRPRQRIRLDQNTPVRPHMPQQDSRRESNDIISEAAAAASDVAGQIMEAPVHAQLGDGPADDFQRMKGVGPKFADMLRSRGLVRFEQLGSLTDEEVARLDQVLGPFRGRLVRDRIVEQAQFLAAGDEDGFQQRFGKL
jgi:predicted flap endonuclease-1-like 5' DNA nuclease